MIVLIAFLKDVFAIIMVIFVSVTILDAFSKLIFKLIRNSFASKLIALISFFLLISFVLVTLVPAVLKEFGGFYSAMMDAIESKSWENYIENPQLRKLATEFMNYLQPRLEEFMNYVVTFSANYVPSLVMGIFFAILGTIYTLFNLEHVRELPKVMYPQKIRHITQPFMEDLFLNLERFVLAIFITALITGLLFFMVFKIFKLDYSVTIGVWAFLTNFMPIVGVLFEYVPVFLFSLSLGFKGVLVMALITLIIHTIAFVTFINMMKGYAKINPVEMLLFIMILGRIYGLLGIFIAVPLTIFLNLFWRHFIKTYMEGIA